ncbi:tripartite tricarboxylate transporter permease [Candidatus Woesearchaeota archaeon]|nr:tripartite tricarboxylate transporter permease [Candidatus Woesearchaeota archaeon]
MFAQIILAILAGVISGTFTGLTPGIHVNLIATILISLNLNIDSNLKSAFILSLAITHTFLDSIPSIFLGAPDDSTFLTALPGHKMLLEGNGKKAVELTIIGSFFSLITAIILAPILIPSFKFLNEILKGKIVYILIILIGFIIFKDSNRFKSLTIFIASGILGLIVLKIPIQNTLLPLLSGFFGISGLILSLNDKTNIPKQNEIDAKIELKPSIIATIVAAVAAFLPGFGSSHSAIFGQYFIKESNNEKFLILTGGINTANMAISIITLYTINKARNGAVLAITKFIPNLEMTNFLLLLIAALITGSIAVFLGFLLTNIFAKIIVKVNYKKLVISIIALITILVLIFTGFVGIIILISSTTLGLTTITKNISRNNMLGCLIIPTISYLL